MCSSAQIWAAWRKFERTFKSGVSIQDFAELYGFRMADKRIKIPKAMDFGFANPQTDDERAIEALIDEFNAKQTTELEQELFKQRKRLADASDRCRPSSQRPPPRASGSPPTRSTGTSPSWLT